MSEKSDAAEIRLRGKGDLCYNRGMETSLPQFQAYAEAIGGERREKFEAFRALLLEYNRKFNLTTVTEEKEMFYKHFLDSAAGEFLLPRGANVAEVGSGAGFPSIPIKLLRDDLTFTLIESTEKKCRFLETAISELGLGGMTVLPLRAEDAGRDPRCRERFDAAIARAVARLNTLAEYCMPLVRTGGIFLAWKGRAEEEIEEAKKAFSVLGGTGGRTVLYELPEGYGERALVLVEKGRRTPEKYPRGRGKERSAPIV